MRGAGQLRVRGNVADTGCRPRRRATGVHGARGGVIRTRAAIEDAIVQLASIGSGSVTGQRAIVQGAEVGPIEGVAAERAIVQGAANSPVDGIAAERTVVQRAGIRTVTRVSGQYAIAQRAEVRAAAGVAAQNAVVQGAAVRSAWGPDGQGEPGHAGAVG